MLLPNLDFEPSITTSNYKSIIKYRLFLENISKEDIITLDKNLIALNYNNNSIDYDITVRVVPPGIFVVSTPLLGYKTGLYRITPIEREQGFVSYMDIYNNAMLYDIAIKELLMEYLV